MADASMRSLANVVSAHSRKGEIKTYCDSVLKTGMVFDWVKFYDYGKAWDEEDLIPAYVQKEPIFQSHRDTKIN